MPSKSKWFLGAACGAMIVALAHAVVGIRVADFAAGLAASLWLGVVVTWRERGHRIIK
jgi:hypothetical protein